MPTESPSASDERDALRAELREAGLRATAPRVAVLSLLRRFHRPLSLAEVVGEIGVKDWDRATLFRNLVKLEEHGFGRIASSALGTTRYEAVDRQGESHVHPHFACRNCKMVTCVHEASLQIPQQGRWEAALRDAELQLVGLCPDCRP